LLYHSLGNEHALSIGPVHKKRRFKCDLNRVAQSGFVGCNSVDEIASSEDDDEMLPFKKAKAVFLKQVMGAYYNQVS
jgi:hypothetical protein